MVQEPRVTDRDADEVKGDLLELLDEGLNPEGLRGQVWTICPRTIPFGVLRAICSAFWTLNQRSGSKAP